MVAEKGQYPNDRQGTSEGTAPNYHRDAQKQEAPDEIKVTKAQSGTVDSAKHMAKTAKDSPAPTYSSDNKQSEGGLLAQKQLPAVLNRNGWILPLGVGIAGYTGTSMILRSLPTVPRVGLAVLGGSFASYLVTGKF